MSRLSGYRIEDEDLVHAELMELQSIFPLRIDEFEPIKKSLRAFAMKVVERSIPEWAEDTRKNLGLTVKVNTKQEEALDCGWNYCRAATLDKAKKLFKG